MNPTFSTTMSSTENNQCLTTMTLLIGQINEITAQLESAIARRKLRIPQIYHDLQPLSYTLSDPNILLLYKQSITLLYDLYQNELEKRSLKPDLLSAQEWIRIVRQLMSQEIAKLYLQSYPTPLKIQNHNKNILPGTFTGHLLCAITSILPPTDATNKKPIIAEGTPLYSDFF